MIGKSKAKKGFYEFFTFFNLILLFLLWRAAFVFSWMLVKSLQGGSNWLTHDLVSGFGLMKKIKEVYT